ncbi:hypothetical protein LWI28_017485 [Acer negundo]|uniref:Gnk2-homologous domain-containing protein n=1 Tax=Acer negundo TaxID=4023 RepID=A0AAD5P4E8_ACENE|nr:hypothetical protein LWI28_017485 [Acer negundo]
MSSLKFSMIFVFLLSLSSSLLTFTIAADPTYLYHVCSKFNFTRNSTYQSNLNLLLSSLPSNANRSDGFSNATVGQDPNRVYGLFQCRGDVTTATCKDCVAFASTDLAQRCPAQKRAVIWYDECLVHYSDSYIFSTAASSPSVRMWNTNNVTTEPSRFHELVLGLMNKATTEAVNDPKKFATIKGNSTTSQPLYVLVQCTQDLSNTNCSRCLQEAIANLPNESIGGRTLTPSCNCRYELYLFYNENLSLSSPPPAPAPKRSLPSPVTPTPSPPSPVTRPKGKSGLSTPITIAIITPITVFAVLFVAGICLLTRRERRKKYTVPDKIAQQTQHTFFIFAQTQTSPETALTKPTSIFSSLLFPPKLTAAMDSPTPQQGKTPTGSTASFNAALMSLPPPAKTLSILLPLSYPKSRCHFVQSNNVTIEPTRFQELMLGLMNEAATDDPKREERNLFIDNYSYRCCNYYLCGAFDRRLLLPDYKSKKEVQICTGGNC